MNVGCADCHLVIYKLSVYVLNAHWSERNLLHSELARRHVTSVTISYRIQLCPTTIISTGQDVYEGGTKGTFINLIGQRCRESQAYEERPFKAHPVSYVPIG